MKNVRNPKIGEIYIMEFSGSGHCQDGRRPGIILQNNVGNASSPNVIAVPLTSRIKKQSLPVHVLIPAGNAGLTRDSVALCENPVCLSKDDLSFYIGTLSHQTMKRVTAASMIATSAVAFLELDEILEIRELSRRLNRFESESCAPVRSGGDD